MKDKSARPLTFTLEFPGDAEVKSRVKRKIDIMKEKLTHSLQQKVNNCYVLEQAVDYWIAGNAEVRTPPTASVSSKQAIEVHEATQKLCITANSSVTKLLALVEDHGRYCSSRLKVTTSLQKGHVTLFKLQCRRMGRSKHKYWWSSSPKLPGNKYLANERVMHGLLFSGMRPSHYRRFCEGSRIGCIDSRKCHQFVKDSEDVIKSSYEESLNDS